MSIISLLFGLHKYNDTLAYIQNELQANKSVKLRVLKASYKDVYPRVVIKVKMGTKIDYIVADIGLRDSIMDWHNKAVFYFDTVNDYVQYIKLSYKSKVKYYLDITPDGYSELDNNIPKYRCSMVRKVG